MQPLPRTHPSLGSPWEALPPGLSSGLGKSPSSNGDISGHKRPFCFSKHIAAERMHA